MNTLTLPSRASPQLSQLLKAAADELRLTILHVLATDSYGVMELVQVFDCKQSGMSHHLKVLANAGLIDSRKEGNSIFYRRRALAPDAPLTPIKKALFQQIDHSTLPEGIQRNLEQVWQERSVTSQRFFVENSHKFHSQQDLIASFEVYRTQIHELLEISPVPSHACALEIGPGQGEFLLTLSEKFERVVALDNSAEMLQKAQATIADANKENVTFVLGDTSLLQSENQHFPLAILNMVLHHTPSPGRVFQHVAPRLEPNGILLITELCSHHQDWAHDACGDIWLGFAPTDLASWAIDAGLTQGQSLYFALRNGFQIQLHQFIKSPVKG